MATVHPQTSFLTLPPEIRLSIYRLLFDGQLLRIRSFFRQPTDTEEQNICHMMRAMTSGSGAIEERV